MLRFVVATVAVLIAWRDMLNVDQQRRKLLASPGVAANGQRAKRVAMIALPPRHKLGALWLTDFNKVLPCQFQCCLNRFRTARDKVHVGQGFGRMRDQVIGQGFGYFGGKETGVRIRQLIDLFMHRGKYIGMTMTQARYRSAAAGVDIAATGFIDDADTVG